LGKAGTEAAVEGVQIYGPHAIGLMIFAVPVVMVGVVAQGVFGVPSAISVPGTGIAIGVKAGFPSLVAMLGRRKTRKDE
jgi:hypothetical protein